MKPFISSHWVNRDSSQFRRVTPDPESQGRLLDGHWMNVNNLDNLERAGTFENARGE
jgi:hypothetical protein